jgi:hypothetical protein
VIGIVALDLAREVISMAAGVDPTPFVGWFWNNTNKQLGIQRIHWADWDPEQLAYFTVDPGKMADFTTTGLRNPRIGDSWIQAQILETDTGNNVSRFTLKRTFWGSIGGQTCSVILQLNDNTKTDSVEYRDTINSSFSFTIWQNYLGGGAQNKVAAGLQPNSVGPQNNDVALGLLPNRVTP